MKTVTLSIGTVCIRPLNTFHPLASIQTTSVSIRYQLLLSNHTIKNIQSSICKFEVPLFHLHSKLSNPLFLSHPFGNRHDYMHGKTLLGKSNGFKSFSLQMFPPGEGKKKKKKSYNNIVSLFILNSSCDLYYSFLLFILSILLLQIYYHAILFTLSCPAGKLIALSFPSLDDVTSLTKSAVKSIASSLLPTNHMQKQ